MTPYRKYLRIIRSRNVSPGPEIVRTKPKNIPQDKERLYEEGIFLKNVINTLKEENLKLKTKLSNLEKEATKFEKMVLQKATQNDKIRDPKPIADVTLKFSSLKV